MKLRTLIVSASVLVSAAFFGGTYVAIDNIFEDTIKKNAGDTAGALANLTFNAMYEVMSTGWRRAQVESFLAATRRAAPGIPGGGGGIQIYRGPAVAERFGQIEQPAMDGPVRRALESGAIQHVDAASGVRYVFPLQAESKCLACHTNARVGTVLGAIDVVQEVEPYLDQARSRFRWLLAALVPVSAVFAFLGVWWVHRQIKTSVEVVDAAVERVNGVADLRKFEFDRRRPGLAEFDQIFAHIGKLVARLKDVAVDKDILKFEIGLLEKFVITSDVVRDWREYIKRLLVDINQVIDAHVLFTVFKIDDELFDLEVFWRGPPSDTTRDMMERYVRDALAKHDSFGDLAQLNMHGHVAAPGAAAVELDEGEVRVHVKSLFVEAPKIGGIVGIGVHTREMEDDTLRLVMDSILSTLLNVVGSVKAIYKYTRDLEYYATRDPLTHLFNQRVFWEMLDAEVTRSRRHGHRFALLMIDLDNFKLVNDSYGHSVGDRFLQSFAAAMRNALRDEDILARYGGDEFVLILPETDLAEAALVAERLRLAAERLEEAAPDGVRIKGTVSLGIAVFPDHAEEAKDLFLFADNMVYKAKTQGKSRISLPTSEDVVSVFRDITQKSVMVLNAIEERRVVPFFQPILDVASGEVRAYEVLSRIEVDGRIVNAGEFVEIAEKIGVIHRIDALVMEKALAAVAESGHDGQVFINLSPRAIVLNEFAHTMRSILIDSGVSPDRIVFEITERDTVKNLGLLENLLNDLKFQGFGLAIDDFGSGFSSFHYLRRFPIDYLKIEGDFIVNMRDNAKDRAFVENMQSLARRLGIRVVAEFVESAEVLAEVRALGIEMAQGYYVGRPGRQMLGQAAWREPIST